MKLVKLLAVAIAVVWFVAACMETPTASAHYRACSSVKHASASVRIACKKHNVYHASLRIFCGKTETPCWLGVKMFAVAGCETGHTYDKWATNGQYHGLWQMGSSARRSCGNTLGRDPWSQARAALCWLRETSMSAWECA
jgi:hypothetical protein